MIKQCKELCHLLEYAVWEGEIVQHESIKIEATSTEYITLLAPLIKSRVWKVNGAPNQEAFLRVLDEVIKIYSPKSKEPLKFNSLLSAIQNCKELE